MGTLGVLIFAWLSIQQVDDEHALTREKQVTDRYNAAVNNIGGDSLEVRLGGIYALQRIMEDSHRDQPSIVNVLSTYIRDHAKKPKQVTDLPDRKQVVDVQAALTALGYRDPAYDGTARVDLSGSYLSRAYLRGANLTGANLTGADLSGATLLEAHLRGAYLSSADLQEADLKGADLRSADLRVADLRDGFLDGADLSGATLRGADLSSQVLSGVDLSGTILSGANLSGVDLHGANLSGADLRGADLRGTTGP
ncbi:pentapeptide repeat-containing protein [Streptomyces longisporus]|uniref:pentapeptide repeat-containing protein n=1 Tax=Streptomyces longisporus TaxID=1948 RepID=UPI0031D7A0D8